MNQLRGIRLRVLAPAVAVGALVVAAVAWGAPVTLPGPDVDDQPIRLNAEGNAFFDPYQPPDNYNDDCALGDVDSMDSNDDIGFTPASDGESDGGDSDAFDGGLVLAVADRIFEDSDQTGDLVGEQLTVGPTKLKGLRVKRIEAALPGSPTLRSLIKLKNKSKQKAKKRTLSWDSDLGADETEVVSASSTGDLTLSDADRWFVFDEQSSDPLGTLALYGKGNGVKKTKVDDPISDQNGCVRHTIRVKVPEKSSRYLLFFTELHDADEIDTATSEASKFDSKKPGGGVSTASRSRSSARSSTGTWPTSFRRLTGFWERPPAGGRSRPGPARRGR